MVFSIVSQVPDLPYLVLSVLFPLLPLRVADLYRDCDNYDIRQLVRARRWQEVTIDGDSDQQLVVKAVEFKRIVQGNTPPPHRIQSLTINLEYIEVSRVIEWADYLEEHVAAVHFVVNNDLRFLTFQPSLMDALGNIKGVVFREGLMRYSQDCSLANVQFPESLRTLVVDHPYRDYAYSDLVLPDTLTTLLLAYPRETPDELPKLPAGLHTLVLLDTLADDFSPFVPLLPERLVELDVCIQKNRRAAISTETARRLPPLLRSHSLEVVEKMLDHRAYMKPMTGGGWRLQLDPLTDYTAYQPPEQIEVLTVSGSEVLCKRAIGHVLPRLPRLRLLQTQATPHCALLLLQVPRLEEVKISRCYEVSGCDWAFISNLTRLQILDCRLQAVPKMVMRCTRLEELDLNRNDIDVAALVSTEFPSSLKRLRLQRNKPRGTPVGRLVTAPVGRLVTTPTTSFRGLARLELLDLRLCGLGRLDKLEFPASLTHLDMSWNKLGKTKFGKVVLPPRLTLLDLRYCELANPWALRLPQTLLVLNMALNRMALPKRGFAFPLSLVELYMDNCWLDEIDNLVLPPLLRRVLFVYNYFPISVGYAWPPRGEISLSRVEADTIWGLRAAFPMAVFKVDH